MVMEEFGEGRFARMVPEWSREKVGDLKQCRQTFNHVSTVPISNVRTTHVPVDQSPRRSSKPKQVLSMHRLFDDEDEKIKP
jgi:hypothetical protein